MSRDVLAEIQQGKVRRYDETAVDFSSHSVARTNERYLRRLDLEAAEHDLWALMTDAMVQREAPGWVFKAGTRLAKDAAAWLVVEKLQLAWPLRAGSGSKRGSLVAGTCVRPQRNVVGANVTVLQGGTQRERGQ